MKTIKPLMYLWNNNWCRKEHFTDLEMSDIPPEE
jgi:hypothetical protein